MLHADEGRLCADGWNVSMSRSTRRKKRIGCVPMGLISTIEDGGSERGSLTIGSTLNEEAIGYDEWMPKGLKEWIGMCCR